MWTVCNDKELSTYITAMTHGNYTVMLTSGYWKLTALYFPLWCHALALDIVSAPASQAYVERVFSVCGDITSGKRNRLSKNLSLRVFLRMNRK